MKLFAATGTDITKGAEAMTINLTLNPELYSGVSANHFSLYFNGRRFSIVQHSDGTYVGEANKWRKLEQRLALSQMTPEDIFEAIK